MIQKILSYLTKSQNNNANFLVYLSCLLIGFAYINWRIFFTIDYSGRITDLIWAVLLILAEIYSFIMFSAFSLAAIKKDSSSSVNKIKDLNYFPSVDIFICTYNESLNILQDTLTGCANIRYPNKKIYLLDDGNRLQVKQLAQKFGCNYITRDSNKGFKAGNINNALKYSNGDIVAVFDADHIPVSTFLMELLDFFKESDVAIVQTPQHFFNPDPFQKNLNLQKYLSNEQDLFFRVIQPGLSNWNATICSGTNFLIRRKHLEKVGGIPEQTITEDMDLGLRLESRNLKVLYYNKPLAAGLAPESFKDYLNQRLRWATGTLQIFLGKSREYFKKLDFTQKFFYTSSLLYYFFGFSRIIFLLCPIVFLLFGIKPVFALFPQIIIFQIIYYSLKIFLFRKVSGQNRNLFLTDVHETSVAFFLSSNIVKTFISPFKHKFQVTRKGIKSQNNDLILLLPQAIILIFAFISLIKAGSDYTSQTVNMGALLLNLFWNVYNILILIFSIDVVVEKANFRKDLRIPFRKESKIQNKDNKEATVNIINLSKKGALLFSQRDKSEELEAILKDEGFLDLSESERIPLRVVSAYEKDKGKYYHVNFKSSNSSPDTGEILKIIFEDSENW